MTSWKIIVYLVTILDDSGAGSDCHKEVKRAFVSQKKAIAYAKRLERAYHGRGKLCMKVEIIEADMDVDIV